MTPITSNRLRSMHGFSTRDGGVSVGPFASLNAGFSVGDERAQVDENLRRLATAARADTLATVSQVHGSAVVEAVGDAALVPAPLAEADAVWSQTVGVAVGVKTADCVPILLEDFEGARVAAVHAGWRGALAHIAAHTVEALAAAGSNPARLTAAIGPCIRSCCYEVSADLAARFSAEFGAAVVTQGRAGQLTIDLVAAVRATLERAGLPPSGVDAVPGCTACEPARFFSHRRDRGVTGRHLAFITCGRKATGV